MTCGSAGGFGQTRTAGSAPTWIHKEFWSPACGTGSGPANFKAGRAVPRRHGLRTMTTELVDFHLPSDGQQLVSVDTED